MKYPGCWMRDAEMLCAGPPNVAGPMPPPVRPGRRARARAKAQAEGLTAKTVQDELMRMHKLTLPATRTGKDGKERPTAYATKTPTSATGTGLDIGRRGDRAGA